LKKKGQKEMFSLKKIINGRTMVGEVHMMPTVGGETYKVGEALKVTSGKVTKCSGDALVEFVSLADYEAPSANSDELPCFVVTQDMVWEVATSAFSATTQVRGAAVTIDTTGTKVTATAASDGLGAKVFETRGAKATGDKIWVTL
jgi:hypothetical protein